MARVQFLEAAEVFIALRAGELHRFEQGIGHFAHGGNDDRDPRIFLARRISATCR